MIELKGTEPKQLEEQLWAGMQKWAAQGGKISDAMWGVKKDRKTNKWVPDLSMANGWYNEKTDQVEGCACAFGSSLLCPPTPSLAKQFKKNTSVSPDVACSRVFDLDNDEVGTVIEGFDSPLVAKENKKNRDPSWLEDDEDRIYSQYFEVGQNLRRRAQKLGKSVWVGSKG